MPVSWSYTVDCCDTGLLKEGSRLSLPVNKVASSFWTSILEALALEGRYVPLDGGDNETWKDGRRMGMGIGRGGPPAAYARVPKT